MAFREIDALTQARPTAGLGRARRGGRASPDEEREAACAPAQGSGAGRRQSLDLLGLRQCRHDRPVQRLAAPRAATTAAVRRRDVSDLWSLDRSRLFPVRFHSSAGARRPGGCARRILASQIARPGRQGESTSLLAMTRPEGQTTGPIRRALESFRPPTSSPRPPRRRELDYLAKARWPSAAGAKAG